jgi:SAM-dependent methyltransferase
MACCDLATTPYCAKLRDVRGALFETDEHLENKMATAFVKQQYDLAYDDGVEHHWWHLARNRIILGEIRKYTAATPEVLDVGCGRGIAVKYLREHGVACTGVELATARPLRGVENQIRYATNAIELPGNERERYSVVTLLDVIEHLPDPQAFIAAIIGAFPRLTHLIATVPARQELWSNFDDYFGHHRRYTLSMLNELAQALNLDVVHQSYFFHSVYLPARAMAALKKPRSTRIDAPLGWARPLHRAISWAMLMDYHLVPSAIAGTSAIACWRVRRPVP